MEMASYRILLKNLGKESRRDLTDGLPEFIKVDNERPGCWRVASRHRNVQGSEAERSGRGLDVTIRESPDELALRAEEVNMVPFPG